MLSLKKYIFAAPAAVRASLAVAAFLAGIWVLDLLLGAVCAHQVARGYWNDDLYGHIARPAQWDILTLGDCRALAVETALLMPTLGRRLLNGGRSASGMGHVLFSLQVLRSRPSAERNGKQIIVFLNDEILGQGQAEISDELSSLGMWWAHLDEARREETWRLAQASWRQRWLSHFNLWKYRGHGTELLRAALNEWRGQPGLSRSTESDGNNFFGPQSMVGRRGAFRDYRELSWKPGPGMAALEKLLAELQAHGMVPVLVLTPLHSLAATPEVNAQVSAQVAAMAARHRWAFLDYLSQPEWSERDEWFGNPAHLNWQGARELASRLSDDLRRVLR